jgi:hypothetical protein
MSETAVAAPPDRAAAAGVPLARRLTWWALAFPAVMVWALARHEVFWLNWIHVLSGVLWTGADLFLGFIIGPVMRNLPLAQRAAVVEQLVPRTLLYFPCVSLTTGTAGWFLASWLGWLAPGTAIYPWIVAALVLVTLMTVQGLGIMLPNSLRIYLELQRPAPRRDLVVGLNRINLVVASVQGVMQVAIIVVMAHFVFP